MNVRRHRVTRRGAMVVGPGLGVSSGLLLAGCGAQEPPPPTASSAPAEIVWAKNGGRLEQLRVALPELKNESGVHYADLLEGLYRRQVDRLKQTVPIWKKEFFEDGAVWAEGEGQTRVLIES